MMFAIIASSFHKFLMLLTVKGRLQKANKYTNKMMAKHNPLNADVTAGISLMASVVGEIDVRRSYMFQLNRLQVGHGATTALCCRNSFILPSKLLHLGRQEYTLPPARHRIPMTDPLEQPLWESGLVQE